MNGQKFAPAFSALPPSLAVVCRGRRGRNLLLQFRHFPHPCGHAHDCMDAGGRATQEQLPRSGVSIPAQIQIYLNYGPKIIPALPPDPKSSHCSRGQLFLGVAYRGRSETLV